MADVPDKVYYAGVEGGGSHSEIVVLDEQGNTVAEAVGTESNVWVIGVDKCLETIHNMVQDVKKKANISEELKFKSLGLALSGSDNAAMQKEMVRLLHERYPTDSQEYNMCNDTFGALATSAKFGIVCISGTGHNTLLINPDGQTFNCGGWGHILADEGSAYWITHKAVKTCMDDDGRLIVSDYDLSYVRGRIWEYFKLNSWFDVQPYFYKLEKSFVARFTLEVLKGARELKDPFCLHLFYEAGWFLGRSIVGICDKADPSLFYNEKCIQVLAVGSIFKSFDLLKEGFLEGLKPKYPNDVVLTGIRLVQLTVGSAVGAALIGAKHVSKELPIDYDKNVKVLFEAQL
ncbi:N-acetyl-D-glucosamine kinase-like [Convolutriloba macropyga]|uniref:N-acetyl-D-glucosamine kinase-like n=1 Tax=Convolutriloba macropyga TaxID=536237 RepID=UPI003F5261C5